jgi:hypothetical protein
VQRARFANRLFWPTRTYQVCTLGHSRSRAPELAEELSTPGRTESSNYVRVCMQPLAFAVCSWAAAWRATGCSPPCVLTLRLPPVCLLTDSPPVPGSGGRSSHHHAGFAGIPPSPSRAPSAAHATAKRSNLIFIHAPFACGNGPLSSQRTGRGTDSTTTALVLRTMVDEAAPVGPTGGISYRFCTFAASPQANALSSVDTAAERAMFTIEHCGSYR